MFSRLPFELLIHVVCQLDTFEELEPLLNILKFKDILSSAVLAIDLDGDSNSELLSKYTNNIVKDIPQDMSPYGFVILKYTASKSTANLQDCISRLLESAKLPPQKIMFVLSNMSSQKYQEGRGTTAFYDWSPIKQLYSQPFTFYISDNISKIVIDSPRGSTFYLDGPKELTLDSVDCGKPPKVISKTISNVIFKNTKSFNSATLEGLEVSSLKNLKLGMFNLSDNNDICEIPSSVEQLDLWIKLTREIKEVSLPELSHLRSLDIRVDNCMDFDALPPRSLKIPSSVSNLKLWRPQFSTILGVENVTVMKTSLQGFPFVTFPSLKTLMIWSNDFDNYDSNYGDVVERKYADSNTFMLDAPQLCDIRLRDTKDFSVQTTAQKITDLTVNTGLGHVRGIKFEDVKRLYIRDHHFSGFDYEQFSSVEELTLEHCRIDAVHLNRFKKLSKITIKNCQFGSSGADVDYDISKELLSSSEWKEAWAQQDQLKELEILSCRQVSVAQRLLCVWPSLEKLTVDIYADSDQKRFRGQVLQFPVVTKKLTLSCLSRYWWDLYRHALLTTEAPVVDVSHCFGLGNMNDKGILSVSDQVKSIKLDGGLQNIHEIPVWKWNKIEEQFDTSGEGNPELSQGDDNCESIWAVGTSSFYHDFDFLGDVTHVPAFFEGA